MPPPGAGGKRRFGVAGEQGRLSLGGMSPLRLLCLCALAATACTGQTAADKPAAQPAPSPMKETTEAAPNVIIHTNYGDMTVEFWPDVAPKTVANFLKLSREGYYTGTAFHRIIKGFMIQGGCPQGTGTGGPGYTIPAEFNRTPHEPGVLSMARTSDPNSAGSQFFLCLEKVPHLDRQYTAFGRTADQASLDVVKAIGNVRTGAQDRPAEPVVIKKVTVTKKAK